MEEQEFTQAQAVSLLVQAADLSQSRGAFKLEEAALVTRAIHLLVPDRAAPVAAEQNEEEAGGDNE